MDSQHKGWSRRWRTMAVLIAIIALVPLVHVHPLGGHDRSLSDPSYSLCGLCVGGAAAEAMVAPITVPALQQTRATFVEPRVLPCGLHIRPSASRAPPAAA